MGGGRYDGDVAQQARSTNQDAFVYSGYAADPGSSKSAEQEVHAILDPYGQIRECMNETPIVVALDVTRSRGDDSRVMYDKLPMFIGQIELRDYVSGAAVSFAAIGDATVDKAPLQVGQFEADNRLDEVLSSFWLEEGGGGTGQESYELAALYYARRSRLACQDRGAKGYFFFVGDEAFYPTVNATQAKRWLDLDIAADLPSEQVFRELQEKYHVFLIYPQKAWEQRKADIDAEVRTRVLAAGGQYDQVDVRASLIWNNRNDLDLHVITPGREEIFYGHKKSRCKGWLDVDMNVRGDTTKPVENVRWKKGEAGKGRYQIIVQNYRFNEAEKEPTPFRLEVEVAGEVKHFDGVVSPKLETGGRSNVKVYQFDFDPAAEKVPRPQAEDVYSSYGDEVIRGQWQSVIPNEHIFTLDDPKAIIDVTLGALAVVAAGQPLGDFLEDMRRRRQSEERIEEVGRALEGLSARQSVSRVEVEGSPPEGGGRSRGGRSRRL